MQDTQDGSRSSNIQNVYNSLFCSGASLAKLKDSMLADRLFHWSSKVLGVAGRSFAWKLFLANDEPLQTSTLSRSASSLLGSIRVSRKKYVELLLEKMRAPDGKYEEGLNLPGEYTIPAANSNTPANLDRNNPLSLHDENPWNVWFAAIELRKTIGQDVERTFPEIAFFRDPLVQAQLTNILFLYSVANPSIGYRQGMHEILASLYFAVNYDSVASEDKDLDSDLRELCARSWVAADAWALFVAIMSGISKWYEWQEPPANESDTRKILATHVQLNVTDGQNDIQPYVAPIVKACIHIQSKLLKLTDPQLWKHMQESGVEPQIYGIRWLRLLFTREFSMPDAMKLWDGLFASDPTLELAQWICVAMLIRVRNELIQADYSGQLTILLRYPSPPEDTTPGAPHHTSLLLRQALALQMSPTPATGASIMIENRNLLNIPLEIAENPLSPRGGHSRRPQSVSTSAGRGGAASHHPRQPSTPQMGLPEMIARGLMERGESLGINKTLMSAVSELRRNIPDLASSLSRVPHQSLSSFPMEDERLPEERPPWEPRTRFEIERDISLMRTRDKRLGESLTWIVDALLQDENNGTDKQKLLKRKQEALESLSYVRDVLINNAGELEEDRLIGEEELIQRKAKEERKAELARPGDVARMVAAPAPASVIDSRTHGANGGRLKAPNSSFSVTTTSGGNTSSGPPGLPPWNYTRSSFSSAGPGLAAGALPRLPPPTSSGLIRSEGSQDPLGALR